MKNILTILAISCEALSASISVTSSNNFETDAQGWTHPRFTPTRDTTGSFDGSSGHLAYQSSSSGQGVRWNITNNSSTWTGNYTAAGITGISLYIDNRSGVGSSVPLRLAITGAGGWFVTHAVIIPDSVPDDEWANYHFDLTPSELTHVSSGTGTLSETLTAVTNFQLLIAANVPTRAGGRGLVADTSPSVDLRFDNITAIPEPSTLLFSTLSLSLALLRRQRLPLRLTN